ncbi:hypothetical protein SAMN03159463_05962 [Mesorhizobium sp. NFR06]|jgi:hypothetical protein|nr:hypothetical protein SAMN03159463_05962 [Mesorhizobium sp. NFR06]
MVAANLIAFYEAGLRGWNRFHGNGSVLIRGFAIRREDRIKQHI